MAPFFPFWDCKDRHYFLSAKFFKIDFCKFVSSGKIFVPLPDMNQKPEQIFISVILPLKFRGDITYIVPGELASQVQPGCRVKVDFAGKIYSAVVKQIVGGSIEEKKSVEDVTGVGKEKGMGGTVDLRRIAVNEKAGNAERQPKEIVYKEIIGIEDLPAIQLSEMLFWKQLADYYMCTLGEVYRAAYSNLAVRQEGVKARKSPGQFLEALKRQTVTIEDEPAGPDCCKIPVGEDRTPAPGINTKKIKEVLNFPLPVLSYSQKKVFEQIVQKGNHGINPIKPVLLHGVTGSGKTEIYVTLAAQQLKQGKNVLFMVPEIAISKQLQSRLKKIFGERLLTFHSKQTAAERARIHKIVSGRYLSDYLNTMIREESVERVSGESISDLATEKTVALQGEEAQMIISQEGNKQEKALKSRRKKKKELQLPSSCNDPINDAVIVLGTRSALFLPYKNLGLVIVDEEHDSSYKQTDPAPRYQARDAAIMLANIHGAQVVLGSATPSFESEYNCKIGRFNRVELVQKFYGAQMPEIEVIDTIQARKSGQMKGAFSQKLINEIKQTLRDGGQALIFRNRRSYSPVVECVECGCIPKCPHCNVYLSYHKYNHTLRCHYCDYTVKFNGICHSCGLDTLKYKGAGTEKIEEELKELLPQARIARFDADVAKSKRAEEEVINSFARGDTDVLVGTQMISKGFDFEHLNLVAVMQADTILGIQDFRADERALQMFNQLMGRTGRRQKQGKLIIQTNQKEHPVILQLKRMVELAREVEWAEKKRKEINPDQENPTEKETSGGDCDLIASFLEERREFHFAPYVRMVKVIIKHRDKEKLDLLCARAEAVLQTVLCKELTGPFEPTIDKVRGEWLKCFYIKFSRDAHLVKNKERLLKAIDGLKAPNAIILDVDPL